MSDDHTASPYESAITAEEYRALADCKYRGNITLLGAR
jgi:hypothetical protein